MTNNPNTIDHTCSLTDMGMSPVARLACCFVARGLSERIDASVIFVCFVKASSCRFCVVTNNLAALPDDHQGCLRMLMATVHTDLDTNISIAGLRVKRARSATLKDYVDLEKSQKHVK